MSKVMESKGMMENSGEEEFELRRGPWTVEEDKLLIHYISFHGEGRWNLLAKCSGLKRTGKSCRLRWLNYLKPDTKRGNLTPHEQILILELHSKWGNRWSKIAQHLPGRTDNEIKNYWRTRVQKQARQLNIDSNSNKFLEALRRFWMPRLLEKMDQSSSSSTLTMDTQASTTPSIEMNKSPMVLLSSPQQTKLVNNFNDKSISNEHANTVYKDSLPNESYYVDNSSFDMEGSSHHDLSAVDSSEISISGCQMAEIDWINDDVTDSFWNVDELWQLRK